MGNSQIAEWLFKEGWPVEAVAVLLNRPRSKVKDVLNSPHKNLNIIQLMNIHAALPKYRTFADLINSITKAPLRSNLYVEDGYLITPKMARKQWTDIDKDTQDEYDKEGNFINRVE